ncbi:MAG TPA: CpsB/CapC family capsule biosynthesis tyrosine phosphatase [Pirellulales bacterium]|nr:CpsB/CapC family capsule biosynthesis tyrosine phosphatase [Pirellulales bacterium]
MENFVDIHCHLLPALDDGAKNIDESLAMARMAVADGIRAIVVTPHQLGGLSLDGNTIRLKTNELRLQLQAANVPLEIYPGGDVRVEPDLLQRIQHGEVLTLADRQKHVLLELPHELFLPIDQLLKELRAAGMVGILSHPERNEGLLSHEKPLHDIVNQGGLLQITAGSLLGTFGGRIKHFAETLVEKGLVHFVATDAHGTQARPPLMRKAFERICQLADESTALDLCARHPADVVFGRDVAGGQRATFRTRWRRWFKPSQSKQFH